jgi:hypothetical protein
VLPVLSLWGQATADKSGHTANTTSPTLDLHRPQEDRVVREIEDFEDKAAVLEKKLNAQSRRLEQIYQKAENRRRQYGATAQTFGPESQEAVREANRLQSAYDELYAQVSARDHLRYQLQNVERAIQDRRYALRGRNVESVWK